MNLLYASDLHGEIHLYQELLDLARASSSEVVALGGDLFPSFPPTRRYEDLIPNQKTFIDRFLIPFFKKMRQESEARWFLLIPGNWDLAFPHLVQDPLDGLIDLDRKIYRFKNDYEFIGYPFVPPTPFRPKDYEKRDDDQSPWPPQKHPSYVRSSPQTDVLEPVDPHLYLEGREAIEQDLEHLPEPYVQKRAIYLMHSPPYGTHLDRIQGGGWAGSHSIRRFIERRQPYLTLHGHIHESPQLSGRYVDRIGQTISINPGQFISKRLHAVTFEIERAEGTLKHSLLLSPDR
ncbi:MAG: metallophosphoesterase [Desulfobacterota bacterium]|nr:metallophosphoesterase [Thermodesulfobacteriota bacterium]